MAMRSTAGVSAGRREELVSTRVRSGLFGNRRQNLGRGLFQRRNSSAPRLLMSRPAAAATLRTELTLTSNRSAASRRDAPVPTASITRSRRSPE